jgi:hypothetical protein
MEAELGASGAVLQSTSGSSPVYTPGGVHTRLPTWNLSAECIDEGRRAMQELMRSITAYDLLPENGKVLAFDTGVLIISVFQAMVEHGALFFLGPLPAPRIAGLLRMRNPPPPLPSFLPPTFLFPAPPPPPLLSRQRFFARPCGTLLRAPSAALSASRT